MLNLILSYRQKKIYFEKFEGFILLLLNVPQIKSWAEISILTVNSLRCQENKPLVQNNLANKITELKSGNWTMFNSIPSISAQIFKSTFTSFLRFLNVEHFCTSWGGNNYHLNI